MVTKTKSKRQQSIKSKLIAAVCMLLVSTIMMVSSTYAWFTLSTAPEVTGITTSVGANGNLEMALLPLDGDAGKITSEAGDHTKAAIDRNVTWGNLVELSEASTYGLDKIMLYPSELKAETSDREGRPLTLGEILLSTPTYGADGRVDKLVPNTITSTFDSAAKNFPANDNFGVRAVGVASGMTDRQLAYRNARSAANTAMAQAKTSASASLNENGDALANIALKKATNDAPTFTQADVNALKTIVTDLLGTPDQKDDDGKIVKAGETGVLGYIEEAYLQYIIAYGASKKSTALTDENFETFQGAMEGAADLYAAVELLATNNVTLPAGASEYINALKATRQNVVAAQTELNALTGNDITWAQISVPLYKLANTDKMLVAGYEASTVRDNMSNIINKVASEGLTVTIASGGGVYADVADHCGDFNASITIDEVNYGGLVLRNMNARMTTKTNLDTVRLANLSALVENAGAPESAAGTKLPITDMYGYVIDLAFRTNAAESNLLLQTEPKSRIYNNEGVEETMGHGASMTFKPTTADFGNAQVLELMNSIRIVFYDPGSKVVLATGKLDTKSTTPDGNGGIKAPIKLYSGVITGEIIEDVYTVPTNAYNATTAYYQVKTPEKDEYKKTETPVADYVAGVQLYTVTTTGTGDEAKTTGTKVDKFNTELAYYTKGTTTNAAGEEVISYTLIAAADLEKAVEAHIADKADATKQLYTKSGENYSLATIAIAKDTEYYTLTKIPATYEKWTGDDTTFADAVTAKTVFVKTTNKVPEKVDYLTGTSAVITALTQNTAQRVSVLVYLDGATISNADVAATAPTSVTGSMNLQFASSANLVPMEYAALMDPTKTDSDSSTGVDVTDYTAFTSAITVNGAGNENIQAQGGFKGTAGYVTLTGVPAGKTATVTGVKVGEQDAPANSIQANTFDGKAGFAFTVPVAPAATDAVVVTITVADATYKVTLPTGTGYTVTAEDGFDANSVTHDGSFAFKVTAAEDYEIKEVKAGNQTLTANADGVYTISNITANVTVTVTAEATSAAPESGT